MVRKLTANSFYKIRDPYNFYKAMREDVTLLQSHKKYLSLTTVIVCCLDALAAGSGKATRAKFESFVVKHLPQLTEALEACRPGRRGSATLYDGFRNGFTHLRAPKREFAIVEDHEVDGLWADRVEADGIGEFVAINVDRLAREFLSLLATLEEAP